MKLAWNETTGIGVSKFIIENGLKIETSVPLFSSMSRSMFTFIESATD